MASKIKVNYYCQWENNYANNHPENWEWVRNIDTSFDAYIDRGMYKAQNNSKNKIGIIREPGGMFPDVKEWVMKEDNWKLFKYIFTSDPDILNIVPNSKLNIVGGVWYITDIQPSEKNKLISFCCTPKRMIQSHIDRQSLADIIKDKVDMYGGYIGPRATTKEIYEDYKFNIVFEPEHNEYHFSEKILNCFSNKCIPINYGCIDLKRWGFDESGIIQIEKPQDIVDLLNSDFNFNDFYNNHTEAIEHNYKNCIQYSFFEDWLLKTYPDIFKELCEVNME